MSNTTQAQANGDIFVEWWPGKFETFTTTIALRCFSALVPAQTLKYMADMNQ